MMDNDQLEFPADPLADERLQQLLFLKRYERPDPASLARNRQNIMREVRQAGAKQKWSLGDLLEMHIPWFFAEPRYGLAALFVLFAGLQFWGAHFQGQLKGTDFAGTQQPAANYATLASASTNNSPQVKYPELPEDFRLFPDRQEGEGAVRFVGQYEVAP